MADMETGDRRPYERLLGGRVVLKLVGAERESALVAGCSYYVRARAIIVGGGPKLRRELRVYRLTRPAGRHLETYGLAHWMRPLTVFEAFHVTLRWPDLACDGETLTVDESGAVALLDESGVVLAHYASPADAWAAEDARRRAADWVLAGKADEFGGRRWVPGREQAAAR